MIYTTEDFDGQHAADYTLLIGVGAATHTLAVVDHGQRLKFAASYDPTVAEAEIIELLDVDFGTVKLAVSDSRYTFIPSDVYDERHRDTYLRYLPYDGVGGADVADILPLGIKLLYQTSRVGMESIAARFPQASTYPAVQALLCGIANLGVKADDPMVVVDRHSPWTTISVFDGGRLMYGHDFEGDHIDDFTYHLLSVVSSLGLANRRPQVYLSGDIDGDGAYHERAAAHGGNAVLADSGLFTGISVPPDFVPHQHRFLTLFGLYRCES